MLLKNVSSNWINLIVVAVISFFTMPFMIRHLGNATYGLWVLIVSLADYMTIFDFGIRSSLNRYISRHYSAKEEEAMNAVISTGLLMYCGLGLLVLASSIVLAIGFPRYFPLSPDQVRPAQTAIVLVGLSLALTFPTAVFNAVLTGLQRYDLLNFVILFAYILRTMIIVMSLALGYGLAAMALATVVANLVGLLLAYTCARRIYRTYAFSVRRASGPTVRQLIHYSFYTFLVIIGIKLIVDTDHVVISRFLGPASVTIYMVASSLINYSRSFVTGVSSVLIPRVSSQEAVQDYAAIRRTLLDGTRYCLLVGWPILAVFLVAGREFIMVWLGPEYRAAYPALVCLSLGWAFSFAESAASATLFGTSKHKIQGLLILAEALVNVTLSVILVRVWGILGVAVGTLVPMVLKNLFVQAYACRMFRIRPVDYWRQSIAPAVLSVLPLALVMKIEVWLLPPRSVLEFALELCLALTVAAALFPWLGLQPAERRHWFERALLGAQAVAKTYGADGSR